MYTLKCSKSKGKGSRRNYDDDEDEELLKDEEDDGEHAGHRLQVQPAIISGAVMREYQMQGLNWLIHLYDNGINGILADEMVSGIYFSLGSIHAINCCACVLRMKDWVRCM